MFGSHNQSVLLGSLAVVAVGVVLFLGFQQSHKDDDSLLEILDDFHSLSKPLSNEEIEKLWTVADEDHSGFVDKHEFKHLLIKLWEVQLAQEKKNAKALVDQLKKKVLLKGDNTKLVNTIHGFEHNKKIQHCEDALSKINDEYAATQFHLIDVDHSGQISKSEFLLFAPKVLAHIYA